MWRPPNWKKNPCENCHDKVEDDYGYYCDLVCGANTMWTIHEKTADEMLEALIKGETAVHCKADEWIETVGMVWNEDKQEHESVSGTWVFIPDTQQPEESVQESHCTTQDE